MKAMLRLGLFGCAIVSVLALSACGGGGGSSSSSSGGDGSSTTAGETSGGGEGSAGGVDPLAEAAVAKYKESPTKIGPTKPIGKPIPSGKKIVYVNCGAEACNNVGEAMEKAAKVLNWELVQINTEPTPQAIQAAFTQALRENPDGIAELGFDKVSFERQLAEMNAKKIPVLAATGTDESGSGIDLQIIGSPTQEESTRVLADKAIVDAGGEGDIGIVELTAYPSIKIYSASFKQEVEKACPACTTTTLQVQPTSIGKDAPTLITNWLRANPDIHHVFLSLDQLGSGLSAALKGAGVEAPKIYSKAPGAEGLPALESGETTAAVPGPTPEVGWQFMDAFARSFTGQSFAEDEKWTSLVLWSAEYDNLPTERTLPVIAGYEKQYEGLWGK
jgi:ribose transport system substrate-binding protein